MPSAHTAAAANRPGQWMTVREVAERLRVKPETVYAYASRGLLHSHREPGERQSRFNRSEVERLATSGEPRSTLFRGLVVQSALTAIDGGHLYYRGRDAVELAREHRFEVIANFLWTGRLEPVEDWGADTEMTRAAAQAHSMLRPKALPLERLRLAIAATGVLDPFRYDLRTSAVVATTSTLLSTAVASLPELSTPVPVGAFPELGERASSLAAVLWSRLSDRTPTAEELDLLNTGMSLLADHELPPSTLAARVIASAGADPYGVIGTGLAISTGTVIASASLAVESYLYDANPMAGSRGLISERLQRGEQIPGFGHLLYPDGDPRATEILRLLAEVGDPERVEHITELLATLRRRGLPPPNVGFALGSLAYGTKMILGAGEAVFGVARAVGWTAHALEEYVSQDHVRQRAVYIGPPVERFESMR